MSPSALLGGSFLVGALLPDITVPPGEEESSAPLQKQLCSNAITSKGNSGGVLEHF